jgi:hypothetical protein
MLDSILNLSRLHGFPIGGTSKNLDDLFLLAEGVQNPRSAEEPVVKPSTTPRGRGKEITDELRERFS